MQELEKISEEIGEKVADELFTDNEANETVVKPGKLSMQNMLSLLSSAVRKGELTSRQAAEMRNQVGLSGSYFTKKKRNKDKVRAARKRARMSRKLNRGLCKGQKRNHGITRHATKT